MPADDSRREMLERIGAYAAGELEDEEAREIEHLIFARPDYRHLAESYSRMLVMLNTLSNEPVEVPEVAVGYAVRRAYVSSFVRSAEVFFGALGRSYLDALVQYLGLRREGYQGT